MLENLIKRYLLEKCYINNGISDLKMQMILYEKFKNGDITIEENEFEIWLHRLKDDKRNFGRCLKQCGYLKSYENVTEITEDKSYSSIKDACVGILKPKQIIAMFGDDCYQPPQFSLLNEKTHLIANGIYDNLKIYLSYIITRNNGSTFSVGYLGRIKDNHTERVITYYKHLKENLEKQISVDALSVINEPILNDGRVYILNYNLKPSETRVKSVITKFSER